MKAKRLRIWLAAALTAAMTLSLAACGAAKTPESLTPASESSSVAEEPAGSAPSDPSKPAESREMSIDVPAASSALDDYAGHYKLTGMSGPSGDQSSQIPSMEALGLYALLELNADGTGAIDFFGETSELTWDETTVTIDGDPGEIVFDGNAVIISHGSDLSLTFSSLTDSEYDDILAAIAGEGADPANPNGNPGGTAGATVESGSFKVTFLGAESAKNYDGADAVRVWYEFTNNSDQVVVPNNELYVKAEQAGAELSRAYFYEDEIPYLTSGDAAIRPGVTVRGVSGFLCDPAGGAIHVTGSDFWSDTTFIDETLTPGSYPAPPSPDTYEIVPVTEVDWLDDIPDEGTYAGKYDVYIGDCESTEDSDGNPMLRFYLDFTNNSDEAESPFMPLYYRIMQDGIQLETGYAAYDKSVPEDDLLYEDVEPGGKVTFAICAKLRTDNPVTVELYDLMTGEIVIGASYSKG